MAEVFEEDALLEIEEQVYLGLLGPVEVFPSVRGFEQNVEGLRAIARNSLSYPPLAVEPLPASLLKHLL